MTASEPVRPSQRKPGRRRAAHRNYLIPAVALPTVLVVLFVMRPRSEPLGNVPDRADLQTAWACHSCGYAELLTPRRRVEIEQHPPSDLPPLPADRGSARPAVAVETEGETSFREIVLPCPKCRRMDLHKARTCTRCGTAFPRMVRGVAQACPKCEGDGR